MTFSKGLEGVVADETAISDVEGDIGRLSYRGYAIEDLVLLDYEAVMWLLLFGELPTDSEQASLSSFLAAHGPLTGAELKILRTLPADLHPMRMLQGMIPLLRLDESATFAGLDGEGSEGLQIVARMPSLIAGFHGISTDGALPEFHADRSYIANFLGMFIGTEPPADHVDILRIAQILQMEHSFNAGTFAGRVVASTLAPVDSVFSAAVGALYGRLHGGADEAALVEAKKVGSPAAAAAYVDDLLAAKGRLMGMGHREYRKIDPRAVILKPMARELCRGTNHENAFETLVALEQAFNARMQERGKELWANVEFYKGAVFEAIGIPTHYFTSLFALARCVGWLAHFIESRKDNRIVRPKARYVGPAHRTIAA